MLQLSSARMALMVFLGPGLVSAADPGNLGLPELPVPAHNPMTEEKILLGKKLFNDVRFSTTGKVSCATCHAESKAFTDKLRVAEGVNGLRGTRNSPTVLNAAFNRTQFWDGRSPDLEDQSQHPFVNPVEMALPNHEPILKLIREDATYREMFKKAFAMDADKIDMKQVMMAIASFERTLIDGNSRFDRWYFNGEKTLNEAEIRGFNVFLGNGRCVSCHVVEQTSALFTDHKFHNIGVGINKLKMAEVEGLGHEFMKAAYTTEEVDKKVLADPKSSELGRFAISKLTPEMGAFKTPTLRNIDLTGPYMHDGSLKTLEEVVEHYNRGGASSEKEVVNPFISGGIRPLNLSEREKKDLVVFMKALTSAKHVKVQRRKL